MELTHDPLVCHNRLMILGGIKELTKFNADESWTTVLGGKHREFLESSQTRILWQFETDTPPMSSLKRLSADRPSLVFILIYDQEVERVLGLVKARRGKLIHHRVNY